MPTIVFTSPVHADRALASPSTIILTPTSVSCDGTPFAEYRDAFWFVERTVYVSAEVKRPVTATFRSAGVQGLRLGPYPWLILASTYVHAGGKIIAAVRAGKWRSHEDSKGYDEIVLT